jgi:carbonic anhydrase
MQSSGPSTDATTESRRRRKKRDVSNTNNATIAEWEKYFQKAGQLDMTNSSTIASFKLSRLIGRDVQNFYRYSGSLTAPPCSETVTWSVFQTPIQFMNGQIENLRKHIFFEDYRGPQLLYKRPVYRSFKNDVVSTIPDNNVCSSQ